MEPRSYVTMRGITVRVVPIPLMLTEVRKANPLPPLPAYTEHLAGGGTQEVEITEEMAAAWQKNDPETWAEHAERWAAFQEEYNDAHKQLNDRIWMAIMQRAILIDLPDDDTWITEQAELGLTVPDDPRQRRIHYIRTEVIGGMPDIWKITAMANGADLSQEALSLAEDSFRDSLAESLLKGFADQARAVEDGNQGGADPGGQGMEAETV